MARARFVQIRNFRGIASLDWSPSPGLNCLIGPGDSSKTTILDAVDLCLGARRGATFCDDDFNNLDIEQSIFIAVTLGELPDAASSMETYGQYLRSYNAALSTFEDEPGHGLEAVLTLVLTVASDLEPAWSIWSQRAEDLGLTRNLAWADRVQIAPLRIGNSGELNLGWRRGSVLTQLTDEQVNASAALIQAAREARNTFGDQAEAQLATTLRIVRDTAQELGIRLEDNVVRALLDTQSTSLTGGTVSLHDKAGVPLRSMGTGSKRLLVAGLQRKAASQASITLVDEVEYGLEPHRVIRLLGSLGAKEKVPPLQVFATTHSPVAVRELAASQLQVVRQIDGIHRVTRVHDEVQGTVRLYPEAFLATSVVVCEGASEVGLLRGLDLYLTRHDLAPSLAARGVALVDAGGITKLYSRAQAFVALGYRTLAFRDDDVQPLAADETAFETGGGKVVAWRRSFALEDAMFSELPDAAITALIDRAIEIHGEVLIHSQIQSVSGNSFGLFSRPDLLTEKGRIALAKASKSKQNWFKSLSRMEDVAADVVGPHMKQAKPQFRDTIESIFGWM